MAGYLKDEGWQKDAGQTNVQNIRKPPTIINAPAIEIITVMLVSKDALGGGRSSIAMTFLARRRQFIALPLQPPWRRELGRCR
jgi:hypothetical protein